MQKQTKLTLFSFLALAGIGLAAWSLSQKNKVLRVLGEVKEFELLDAKTRAFRSGQVKGKVWVANFIFTNCPAMCPMMTEKMKRVRDKFGDAPVEFVSISVDPERDTPAAMSQFAKEHGAVAENWHFLTGTRKKIDQVLVEHFKIGTSDEPVHHSDRMVLMDGKSQIRGYYSGMEPGSFRELTKDIALLLK